MRWKPRELALAGVLLLALPWTIAKMTDVAFAQGSAIATTQVTDTIYRADGTAAGGTVIVSWPSFTTSSGQSVSSGSTSATLGAGGSLSLQLVPNAGSNPMGSYYTAVFHLDDGSVNREYWVIPVSAAPVSLSAVQSSVLPTSVAMQTVSKAYVDTAIAAAVAGHPLDTSNPYVLKAGDTMTGPLVLPGDPTTTTQAADKHYVDVNVTAVESGLAQKVSQLPAATQTVSQPAGTQLHVNILNGSEYASQYIDGRGGNGVANAVASPDCAGGCDVKVEHSYNSTESYQPQNWNSSSTGGTHVEDARGGMRRDSYLNPTDVLVPGTDAGQVIDVVSTRDAASEYQQTGAGDLFSKGLSVTHEGLAGGSNLFPQGIDSAIPYFKTTYSALAVDGTYNTLGQHVLAPHSIKCYGVGDCLMGSQFLTASGGFRDNADEGAHPFDLQIAEDTVVFQGMCSSGCTTGSTAVNVVATSAAGTQGEGRYLINTNPAKVISTGLLVGAGGAAPGSIAYFSGTSFGVSTFLSATQAIQSQANNMAPGTVTIAIATSGVTAGFATNTAALSSPSGVACVSDQPNGSAAHNFEMANYTVIDGTHLQMTLNKPHEAGTTIAVGGLCGYGLEQTVDTARGIRQVFPVIGSFSSTSLYYAAGLSSYVGAGGNSSAFLNVSLPVASIARSGSVVTVTTAGNLPVDVNGLTMAVTGVTDGSYNGSFAVTTTGPNTLTYSEAGANSTSSGGTISILTGGYALYPMAEVLGVFNATTKQVDGQMTLAPNSVQWAVNDPVEEPHYYQENVSADTEFVSQTIPRPLVTVRSGIQYQLNVGPGIHGFTIANAAPVSNYLGNGGTHTLPYVAYEATGAWRRTFEAQAGDESVFSIHCNSHGCGKWNSGYNVFEFDSNVGLDWMTYQPQNSGFSINLRGTGYGFSPQAFTAGTINAGTVNATTLNGAVSAAQLPVFVASGSGHAAGAVPDPGATAGTTRYLREDGTWIAPPPAQGGSVSGLPTGLVAVTSGTNVERAATASDVTAALGFAPLSNGFVTRGISSLYITNEGVGGTVLHDISGANACSGAPCNVTLTGAATDPVFTSQGLNFISVSTEGGGNQTFLTMPAGLSSARSLTIGSYIAPPANGVFGLPASYGASDGNTYFTLASSDGGGLEILAGPSNRGSGITPYMQVNGAPTTRYVDNWLGAGTRTFTLGTNAGTDPDHAYLNTAELNYTQQGASAGGQTGYHYVLGNWPALYPSYSTGLPGIISCVATYTVELTAAEALQNNAACNALMASRGVPVTVTASPSNANIIACTGDSIFSNIGSTTPVCNSLSGLNDTYTAYANGIPGWTCESIQSLVPIREKSVMSSFAGKSVGIVECGQNDIAQGDPNATVANKVVALGKAMKAAGVDYVFLTTLMSASGRDGNKDAINPLIRAGAAANGFGLVDFNATQMMADGANANTAYFLDGIHPTGTAKTAYMAAPIVNNINEHYGSTLEGGCPTVITAATYTEAAADGCIQVDNTSNAVAVTMPDCMGYSKTRRIKNLGNSAAAVTVLPNGSELIDGSNSAITVASKGMLVLVPVTNSDAAGGCHWSKISNN
jgi:trimeric autotransporter adhesin